MYSKFYGQAERAISNGQLNVLLRLHTRPIKLVVYQCSCYLLRLGDLILRKVSRLYAFSVYPNRTSLPSYAPGGTTGTQEVRSGRPLRPGPLVLRASPLKSPTPTTDRDRTVSRRSEPSSRTALIGEQPNPWELLHPQDAMSRHRGAKPERRCELLTPISLLSPAYLLSVERWPFHTEPPDHLRPHFASARLVGLAVNLAYAFALDGGFPNRLSQASRA